MGNGVYNISIYDNNYPNDRNRRMVVDTSNLSWTYYGIYRSSTHDFRFINTSIIYSSVQKALEQQANPQTSFNRMEYDMTIIIPTDVIATQNGVPISEIENIVEITPLTNTEEVLATMWYLPDGGIVEFEAPG
jgi:hypothetical protein